MMTEICDVSESSIKEKRKKKRRTEMFKMIVGIMVVVMMVVCVSVVEGKSVEMEKGCGVWDVVGKVGEEKKYKWFSQPCKKVEKEVKKEEKKEEKKCFGFEEIHYMENGERKVKEEKYEIDCGKKDRMEKEELRRMMGR